MSRGKKLLLGVAWLAFAAGVVAAGLLAYSAVQLRVLKGEGVYANPEDGMRAMVAKSYSGVNKVEIVHAGRELFDELWFVEAHVWASGRADGKGFSGREYDNPGSFFLHVEECWVFVPEGRLPEIIALGKWLFGLSGSKSPGSG
ncbi:MAG: hypothetical protein ACYS6W_04265 [Planctomycetota bacterium]|jgi:hypothetical protein